MPCGARWKKQVGQALERVARRSDKQRLCTDCGPGQLVDGRCEVERRGGEQDGVADAVFGGFAGRGLRHAGSMTSLEFFLFNKSLGLISPCQFWPAVHTSQPLAHGEAFLTVLKVLAIFVLREQGQPAQLFV